MITYKEKVEKDIENFELKIQRAKEYADKQEWETRVMLYRQIAGIEFDLNALKRSLGPHFGPVEKTRDFLEPEVEENYKQVIKDLKELDEKVEITIWFENPSIIETLEKQFRKLKEKIMG